ncbi:MAG TPA: TonB-dependent receptor, partial [Candidatus Dormibacteraeota bacterium]|nr:TonB-dependent receptor [Candidatus Dormibacteraeota bacterium]
QLSFKDIDKYGGMLVDLGNDWTAGTNSRFGTRGPAPRENPNWSVTPNVNWIKGRHNLQTGFWFIDSKRVQLNTFQTFNFIRQQTGDPSGAAGRTGLTLASALLALPGSFSAQLPVLHGGPVRYKYGAWAAYVQDEWKVKPTFTLNLGLRYDYLTQPQTTDGRLWSTMDVTNKQYEIGSSTMPPFCSQAQQSPCIPDGAPLYTPRNSACNNKVGGIPCDFRQDPHFSNVVLAGSSFFDPPPIKDNWAPRVGLAWQVTRKTVIRTGYGLYWDTLSGRGQAAQNDLEHGIWPDATAFSGDVNSPLDFSGGTSKLITDLQGNFPTPLPGPTPWTAGGFALDPHKYKDGYSQQWQVEIQREVTPNLMFSSAYVGSKNGRLDYEGKANSARFGSPAVTDPMTTTAPGVTTCGPSPTAACKAAYLASIDALRAMPWANPGFTYAESIGYSNYHALEARMNRRFANGFESLLSYTFSKSIDVSSGYFGVENGNGGGSAVQNFYDQSTARGVSGFDITHFLSWYTVYEFPIGRGKKWLRGGPLSWILGNWQGNYIFQARSGQPYTLRVTGDVANLTGTGGVGAQSFTNYGRPNVVSNPFQAGPVAANPDPKCQLTISQGGKAADQVYSAQTWFNPCAFTVPDGFGNLGRDAYRGSPVYNVDFSLFKSVPLAREGTALQIRFEAFNVLNIQNWDTPTTQSSDSGLTVGNKAFGRINTLAHDPRQLQFGLRFTF